MAIDGVNLYDNTDPIFHNLAIMKCNISYKYFCNLYMYDIIYNEKATFIKIRLIIFNLFACII